MELEYIIISWCSSCEAFFINISIIIIIIISKISILISIMIRGRCRLTLPRSNEFSTRITNRWKVPSFHNGRHDYYLCHNSTKIFIMIMIMMVPRCQHCRCPWRLLCLRLPPRPLQIKAQANVEGAPGIFHKSMFYLFCTRVACGWRTPRPTDQKQRVPFASQPKTLSASRCRL